ncbi:MAG: H+-transporting two-sector ATPase, gamma subunit [Nitrosospira sp.]
MSDTTASLRRKIDNAKDLRSVVSTMKALAAASIGQYEKSVHALEDYHRTVQLGLSVCFRANGLHGFPMEKKNMGVDCSVTGAVVFGSDQGLVGQFNDSIAEYAARTLAALPGRKKIWVVGERVHDRLADLGLAIEGSFTVPLSIQMVTPLTWEIMLAVLGPGLRENEMAELYLFYNRPRSGSTHAPFHHRLLPLDEAWRRELSRLPWPARNLPEVVGGNIATLPALIREYLFVSLFRACAESLASESASRLAAMERAEKNIDELSGSLQQTFNRLRQSRIDAELFDVIAGVEAVSEKAK